MHLDFTHIELFFLQALALLTAACFFVPLFKKLGLGTVLGYLIAGVVINWIYSGQFADHPQELLHFSEFGVVLFLFVIGLELNPSTLWQMRKDIFGLGLLQMAVTGLVLTALSLAFGMTWQSALVIGMGMALSSTAIVMSSLDENGERMSAHGRKAFGILLFQDLAIVPLLLMVTLLAPSAESMTMQQSLVSVGIAATAVILLILIGKFALDPLFNWLAKSKSHEIMTACALAIVIAAAMLMDIAGMSYAMGAFIAGVMLAESNYRHEMEANIEPFKGLFLGLFFMAVGLSVDLSVVQSQWLTIILIAPLVMLIKALALYLAARLTGHCHNTSVLTAMALPQLGEFGFVLFTAASAAFLLDGPLASLLIAITSMTMVLSPLFSMITPLLLHKDQEMNIEENFDDALGKVLIIGFGRFGQIVSQPLFADGMSITILDNDAKRVQEAKKFGFRVHFGDGCRRDILRAAGINNVQAVIVATDKPSVTTTIIDTIIAEKPKVAIYARSYDRRHSIEMYAKDIEYSVRETFESALHLSQVALRGLGVTEDDAIAHVDDIRKRDRQRLREQVDGDMQSGKELLLNKPVEPELLKQHKSVI
ncbi:monovalent cation:proton antiporter-2 (CPA2) family protein [Marinicella rhabdoformis]|uniref:monovalent cation:proton antiporter-2 (CPA2) family protein n=1 Tax=Marinicella rhabdoformis TaxID=2580566 RepID=UPI0012AED353|nr:monovalent cation:proton antiporter-2 (CPA2) family protein [Marinicella rhabdoformis]